MKINTLSKENPHSQLKISFTHFPSSNEWSLVIAVP